MMEFCAMTPDYKQGYLDAVKAAKCGGFNLSASVRAVWEELVIAWIARADDSNPPSAGAAGVEFGRRRDPKPAPARKPRSKQAAVNFADVPPRGTEIVYKGQRYVSDRAEPYTCKNGSEITLIVWQSHCVECGEPFEARTRLKSEYISRRCPQHTNTRKPVDHTISEIVIP